VVLGMWRQRDKMITRGIQPNKDKPAHLFCCGEEIYTVPAGKELLMGGRTNRKSVRASIKCPRCSKLVVLCLVDGAA
jgi:hypothetical protein